MTICVAATVLPLVPRVSPPPPDTLIRDEDVLLQGWLMMSRRYLAGVADGAEDLAMFRTIHIHLRPQSRAGGTSGEQSVLENLDGDSNRMRERDSG
jgi:hypothetical protein